jgi:hypothetical protein
MVCGNTQCPFVGAPRPICSVFELRQSAVQASPSAIVAADLGWPVLLVLVIRLPRLRTAFRAAPGREFLRGAAKNF